MTINGLRYATVKDTIKNVNIIVPKCNCRLAADREKEEERIRNDLDRNAELHVPGASVSFGELICDFCRDVCYTVCKYFVGKGVS